MMEDIEAHRRALADVLDALTAEQWHGSSMCAGWSPAHVLAHLTMPFRIPPEEFMTGLQRAGDFTRYSDEVAGRDSQIPQERLVAVLRANAANPWSPPGGGLLGALSHDVIHGLDVTWPLPVSCQIPDRAMAAVLESVAADGHLRRLAGGPAGVRHRPGLVGRRRRAPPRAQPRPADAADGAGGAARAVWRRRRGSDRGRGRAMTAMADELSVTFAALADPTRRAILTRLADG